MVAGLAPHYRYAMWLSSLVMSITLAPMSGVAQDPSTLADMDLLEPVMPSLTGCVQAPAAGPRELAIGTCYRSTLDQSDPEIESDRQGESVRHEDFVLPLQAGETVMIDMDAIPPAAPIAPTEAVDDTVLEPEIGFDTYLEVFAPDGERLRWNDDRGNSLNSTLLFRAPAIGRYIIRARSFLGGTGDYVIRARAAPPPRPLIRSVSGRLDPADASGSGLAGARYTFEGTEGERMRLALQSTIPNATLLVEDSAGAEVGSDSDADGSFEIVAILPRTGSYIVILTADAVTAAQDFTLDLARAAAPAAPAEPIALALEEKVEGALTLGSDARVDRRNRISFFYQPYSLVVEAGRPVVVEMESSDFRPSVDVAVLSPLGYASIPTAGPFASPLIRRRSERNRFSIELRPERSGTVIIRARGPRSAIGAFRLRAQVGELAPNR